MSGRAILYSFRRCPYAMRARLALLISETVCEIREVKLSDKPAELLAASTKATVPVLVRKDGSVIDESLDIMRWALERNDPEKWLAREDKDLIASADGEFKQHLDRYKYPDRYGSDPHEHRSAGLGFLQVLEGRLNSSAQLHGAARGITDAAIFPFVRQFAATDSAWFAAQQLPRVQRWLAQHLASDLFGQAMVRLTPWLPGDPPLMFPPA